MAGKRPRVTNYTIRVVAQRSIITDENDLIVAGTGGVLLRWSTTADFRRADFEKHRLVDVKWDLYLFDEGHETDDKLASTHAGLVASVSCDDIALEGSK